jgi:hypothetical protein
MVCCTVPLVAVDATLAALAGETGAAWALAFSDKGAAEL